MANKCSSTIMKRIKKIVFPLLYMANTIFCNANNVMIEGFNYKLDADTQSAEVIYSGLTYKGDIVLPSTIVYENITYDVTSIGEEAFYKQYQLNTIKIPNSITSIGHNAFSSCI